MSKAPLWGFAFALLPLATAQAAPATADEASRLTTLFQLYVGMPAAGQPSAVTVSPDGESYRVTLDLKQATKGLESFGFTMDPDLSTTVITPLPDGTWKVLITEAPPAVIHLRDQSIALKFASTHYDGIYAPRMFSFKSVDGQFTGYDYSSTGPKVVQNSHTDKLGVAFNGMPAEGGTVTGKAHEVLAGVKADVLVKPQSPPQPASSTGAPAVPVPAPPTTAFSYSAPSASLDLDMDKFHSKDLLDLWAFLVAHPNRDSLTAAQDELRGILRSTLPLASALKEDGTIDGLSITTPIGVFSAKTAASSIGLANLDGTAEATTRFAVGGLTVPPGQLPPWTAGLVPTEVSLAITADGLHLAEAASEAVNDFDLRSDKPFTPEQNTKIGHLVMPGIATVTLLPSQLTSKLLDLKLDGAATFGDVPEGHLTVVATGLDKAIASLQAAASDNPAAAQALGPLVLAKNLAKPRPDGTLSWLVEVKGSGPVTINGTPLQ